MTGTLVNTLAVIVGSILGMALGGRLPEKIKEILFQALGLSVIYLGIKMALEGQNSLLVIASVIAGGLTGEIIGIQDKMERLAGWLKKKLGSGSPTFVEGFVTASVMYLVGPMTILGCIEDGVAGKPETLYIKSLFDGVASIVFASSLGVGVAFSAVAVLVVQGGLSLFASHLLFMQEPAILSALTGTGGVLIIGIGITILDLKKIRTANLLPGIFYAIGAAALL